MVLAMMVLAPWACAAESAHPLAFFFHASWTTETGLPQNSVEAIAQTDDGYLWFGTQNGLVRFNGTSFKIFDKENTPAFKQNILIRLCKTHDGSLWIGAPNGTLARYKDGAFEPFTRGGNLP